MRLSDFLLELLTDLPILLGVLVGHLVQLCLNLRGLGPELLDEFELNDRLITLIELLLVLLLLLKIDLVLGVLARILLLLLQVLHFSI